MAIILQIVAYLAGLNDLPLISIHEASNHIRNGSLRPAELVKDYLSRIDAVDSQLRSFIYVTRDEGLAAAQQADNDIAAGNNRGPLHGIPFGIWTCTSAARSPPQATRGSILAISQNKSLP